MATPNQQEMMHIFSAKQSVHAKLERKGNSVMWEKSARERKKDKKKPNRVKQIDIQRGMAQRCFERNAHMQTGTDLTNQKPPKKMTTFQFRTQMAVSKQRSKLNEKRICQLFQQTHDVEQTDERADE